MNYRRCKRLLTAGACFMPLIAQPQVPLGLDTTFRTEINTWGVASVLPMDDGGIIISGQVAFPGEIMFRNGARLNADGSQDLSFPQNVGMGGKLTPWNGRIYAASGNIVRRLWPEGNLDSDFISMTFSPYFTTLQGGDYHVFPDGRLLIAGRHLLNDTIRDFVGPHCLCWFSNEGYLDTTKIHRPCSGVLAKIQALPNGQFMGSGTTSTYDGQPASNIFRFNADGSLDPSFQANVTWGLAYGFLPLDDGRVYAAGRFTINGTTDTLSLVRFQQDGSLDGTFDHLLDFRVVDMTTYEGKGLVRSLYQIDGGRMICMGSFEEVDGQPRNCICIVDSAGTLLDDYFTGAGCGNFVYQGETGAGCSGMAPSPDGSYYIWGTYHGYDDGTTNDTTQRMVSRLYGLDVGVREHMHREPNMNLFPNPCVGSLIVQLEVLPENATLAIRDALGSLVIHQRMNTFSTTLDLHTLSPGIYLVELLSAGKRIGTQRLVVQ